MFHIKQDLEKIIQNVSISIYFFSLTRHPLGVDVGDVAIVPLPVRIIKRIHDPVLTLLHAVVGLHEIIRLGGIPLAAAFVWRGVQVMLHI